MFTSAVSQPDSLINVAAFAAVKMLVVVSKKNWCECYTLNTCNAAVRLTKHLKSVKQDWQTFRMREQKAQKENCVLMWLISNRTILTGQIDRRDIKLSGQYEADSQMEIYNL